MRIPAAVLVVTAMWGAASTAWAQQDDKEKKMREESMKERLDAMEKKVNDSVTFWANNGLKFKTADGNFEGAIGGRFYFVYRNIFERVDLGTTAANGFIFLSPGPDGSRRLALLVTWTDDG